MGTLLNSYRLAPVGWTNNYRGDLNAAEYLLKAAPSFSGWTGAGGRTLEMWVTFDDLSSSQDLFTVNDMDNVANAGFWRFRIRSGANNDFQIQARIRGASATPVRRWNWPGTIATGTRYHIVVTNDGTTTRAFVDNVEASVKTLTPAFTDNWWGGTLSGASVIHANIGALTAFGTALFFGNCRIDRVTLWDRQITNDTADNYLTELYNGGTIADPLVHSLGPANCLHHWDFENRITDRIGTDHMAGAGGWVTAINPPGPGNIVPS